MGNKTRNTSNLVSDNNIFVDISNDRVGIGTTQPTTKLDVVGTIKATSFSGITTAMISDYGSGLAGGYSNATLDNHINVGTANTGEVLSWNGTDYDWVVGVQTANINADTLNVSGVSTFQNNVHLLDDDKLLLGGSAGSHDGLEIYHNGSHNYIKDSGSGNLYIGGNQIWINDANNINVSAVFNPTSYSALYYNGSKKFETTADGITVHGDATFNNVSIAGTLTYDDVTNVDSIGLVTARSGVRVTSGGLDVVGVSTFAGNIDANGDLDVDGHTELDNVNVSGVITATTFTGNGGTITNVDAVTAYSADLSTLATIADKVSGKLTYTEFDQISQVDQPAGTPRTVASGDDYDLHAAESYLSKDGKTLFVSRFNFDTQNESNVVTIYERNQSGFNYVGFITETTYANVGAGQTVTYWGPVVTSNSDGSIFAIGSPDGFGGIDARSKLWWLDHVEDNNSQSTGSQQSVHIYQKTGNKIESLGIITASQYGLSSNDLGGFLDSDGEDGFGTSLALSDDGSKLYIGAPHYFRSPTPIDSNSSDFVRGRVYAFDKSGSSYNFVGIITQTRDSTHNGSDNEFGISVACSSDGNKIYIGDPQTGIHTSGHPDAFATNYEEGVVYAYDRSGSNFNCVGIISTRLFPEGNVESFYGSSRFGFDVACSDDGNTIIISAPNIVKSSSTASNGTGGGAIHVVSRDGNTFSSSGRHIHTSADNSGLSVGSYFFGRSIACNSDASKILSGKTNYGSAGVNSFGEVFSFSRSESNLTLSEILTSPRETSGSAVYSSFVTYGSNISIDSTGDTVAIGAPGHIVPGETVTDSGAVFLFSASRQIALHGNQLTNNIGIGTTNTNPTSTLDVDGTFKVSGVSTFKDQVHLPNGSGTLNFGPDIPNADLVIGHNGQFPNSGYISNISGDLDYTSQKHIFSDENEQWKYLELSDTESALYGANTKKLSVSSTGVSITDDVNIGTGGTTAFFDVSSGKVGIGTTILTNGAKLSLPTLTGFDGDALFSAGNQLSDYSLWVLNDSANADPSLRQKYVRQFTFNHYTISVGSSKAFRVSNSTGFDSSVVSGPGGASETDVAFVVNPNTSTELRYNYNKKLETTNSGVTVTGGITATSGFATTDGTSSQFLKADGSVDSSTYLTSYTETQTLDNVVGLGSATTQTITVGTATTGVVVRPDGSLNVSGVSTFLGNVSIGTAAASNNVPGLYLNGSTDDQYFFQNPQISIGGTAANSYYDIFLVDAPDVQYVRHWASDFDINFSVKDARQFVVSNTSSISASGLGVLDSDIAFKIAPNASTELRYNRNKKLETTGYGVTVSGGLNVSGISTFQDNVGIGITISPTVNLALPTKSNFSFTNPIIRAGSAGDYDFTVVDNANQQYVRQYTRNNYTVSVGATHAFRISNASGSTLASAHPAGMTDDEIAFVVNPNTSTELRYNYDKKLETTGYGVTVTGGVNVSGVVTASSFTGSLTGVATTATNIQVDNSITGQVYPLFVSGNNSGDYQPTTDALIKWDLTENELTTTRIVLTEGLDLQDNDYIYFGSNDEVKLLYDGSADDFEIQLWGDASQIAIGDTTTYKHIITKDGKVGINTSVTPTVELDVNGDVNVSGFSTFYGDVSLDGTSTKLSFDASTSDSNQPLEPKIQIDTPTTDRYYKFIAVDDTNVQYVRHLTSKLNYNISIDDDRTFLISDGTFVSQNPGVNDSNISFKVSPNASTELRYNKSKKLETTGYGVTVTGGVNVSGAVTATEFSGGGSNLTGLTGASAATYGDASNVAQIVVDATGRITGISEVAITGGGGTGTGYFSNDQTNPGIHTTASNVGLGTTNPITSVQVNDVYGIETGTGSFTATAGVAYTANTYTSSDFSNSEYTLFFEHTLGIQSQKVLVMDDETTAYSQEYAIMSSSDLLVSVSATIKSGNVELWFTPESGVSGIVTYKFTRETII